jgi:hypothetical protein
MTVEAMEICEKQDKTITFSDCSGEPIFDLHDSPNAPGVDAAVGVDGGYNDGHNDVSQSNKMKMGEQHENEDPNEDTEYGGVPGVTATEIPAGVTTEVTGVHPVEGGIDPIEVTTGVATEGTEVVNVEGATVVTNNKENTSGCEDDAEVNGIETPHDDIPEDEVYHPDFMTPSVQ